MVWSLVIFVNMISMSAPEEDWARSLVADWSRGAPKFETFEECNKHADMVRDSANSDDRVLVFCRLED